MNGTNYEVPHCGAFSTPHSHRSWAQILASGSCFQIPLFPVGLPFKIPKALLPSSILAKLPAHLNLLDLITLTVLGERYRL